MKRLSTIDKIKKLEQASRNTFARGNSMYSKKMQSLMDRWVALKELAVLEGTSKRTKPHQNEFDGYDFGDVCA